MAVRGREVTRVVPQAEAARSGLGLRAASGALGPRTTRGPGSPEHSGSSQARQRPKGQPRKRRGDCAEFVGNPARTVLRHGDNGRSPTPLPSPSRQLSIGRFIAVAPDVSSGTTSITHAPSFGVRTARAIHHALGPGTLTPRVSRTDEEPTGMHDREGPAPHDPPAKREGPQAEGDSQGS